MSKTFSQSDVSSHNKPDSLFIVIDGDVYDVTKFQDDHPGGKKILQKVGGKDASKQFWKYHNAGILKKYQKQLQVGSLDSKPKSAAPPAAAPKPKQQAPKAVAQAKPAEEEAEALEPFGQQIPFADPSWYQSVCFGPTFNLPPCLCPASFSWIGWLTVRNLANSITLPTSTKRMQPSGLRCGNGLRPRLSHT